MKLPKFILNRLAKKNTSLGDNKALPPEEDYSFERKILQVRLDELTKQMSQTFPKLDINDQSALISLLNKKMTICQKLEEPIRENLVKTCENAVNTLFQTPSETVILSCKLVDQIKPKYDLRTLPEEASCRDFDFQDLNDFHNVQDVILKRRFINALIQGIAITYAEGCDELFNQIEQFNPKLNKLYHEIVLLNSFLLYTKEEKITNHKHPQGACVEVELMPNGEKSVISSQGLIFPYLYQETIRGFCELFASHGLPDDNKKANYIIKQADFLVAEPWDMRLGVGLWKPFNDVIENSKYIPYLLMTLCELPVAEFNDTMQEILAHTQKGQSILNDFINNARQEFKMNSFIDTVNIRNANVAVLNDEYMSADDLDACVIEEEGEVETCTTNDDIEELLIVSTENDWDFEVGEQYASRLYRMKIFVKGKEIPSAAINLRVELLNILEFKCYQLHIYIDPSLRHNGLTYKCYAAFIREFGNAITLLSNRSELIYKNMGSMEYDDKIEHTWSRLAQHPNIQVGPIMDNYDNLLGHLATWEDNNAQEPITESATKRLFHFCSIDSLKYILENDRLELNNAESRYHDDGATFSASFTRNINSKQGYPYMQSRYSNGGGTMYNNGSSYVICRIEFDGDKLNTYNNFKTYGGNRESFKVKPFDFMHHYTKEEWELGGYEITNGKEDALNSTSDEEKYHQPFSQAEDRLTSNYRYIPNITKYIKTIDILVEPDWLFDGILANDYKPQYIDWCIEDVEAIRDVYQSYGNLINLYDNQDYFDHQTNQVSEKYLDGLLRELNILINEELTVELPLLTEDKGISNEVMSTTEMIYQKISEQFNSQDYKVDAQDGLVKYIDISFQEPIFNVITHLYGKIILCDVYSDVEIVKFIQEHELDASFRSIGSEGDIYLKAFAFNDRLPMMFIKKQLAHELEHAWQYYNKLGKVSRKTKYQDLNKKGVYMSRSGDDIMRQISETLYFLSKSELDAFIHTAYSELETAQYKISMENVFQTVIYQQFQEYKKTVNEILTEFDQKDVEKVLKTFNLSRGEFKRYAQHMIEYGERKFKQIQERFESNRQNKLDKQKRDLEEILKICPKYGDMLLI